MIKYTSLDIRIECNTCGEGLEANFDNYKSVIKVEPCPVCTAAEYESGREIGFDEGYDVGYDNGSNPNYTSGN